MWAILIGAALIIGGFLFLFTSALGRKPSNPHRMPQGGTTLEPRRQGLRFLGISQNWPALALIAIGALLLAFGGYS
ncbi:hypothetical protein [Rhizobium leguminosarum]|uniref:hypothetical protein n=1 Tax=Rhizobium leguminosarum TaxID=384 RepID=UPI0014411A77|nr:hypothetical protein [Rhizobium leguminosarum]NKN01389.1 hypothetical protein [Rhizobium leguminosarum bv. viciae]